MERDRESILSLSRFAMGHGSALATSAPQPEPPVSIHLEPGDIVVELESDVEVAPRKWTEYPTEPSVGGREKL
jgi:hypothetical protein